MRCEHVREAARSAAYGEGYDEGWHECYDAVTDWLKEHAIGGPKEEKVLPHPCDGELYQNVSTAEQMLKIYDEYRETQSALTHYHITQDPGDRYAVGKELTDVIIACTTMLDKLGFREEDRQILLQQINQSNKVRDHGKRFKKDGRNE